MKRNADGKYAQPSFANPGLERWAQPEPSSEGNEADESGWRRDKVIRDIRETAKSEKFTSAQVEEWEALFDFHLRHSSPESLSMAPHVLTTATTNRSIKLHGMPIPWDDMWSTLRRLPRAHIDAGASASLLLPAAPAAAPTSSVIQKGLALENSVTGTNYPRKVRAKAAETFKTQTEVSQLPPSLTGVPEMKQLYFIALPEFEGEMSVGIGRVCKLNGSGEQAIAATVEWLQRRGWSNTPNESGFHWGKSPMFDAFKEGYIIATNEHPLADFLPVSVELTEGSVHLPAVSLTNKQQRFCLQALCVVRLQEFCALVRPELLNKQAKRKSQERNVAKEARPKPSEAVVSAGVPGTKASSSSNAGAVRKRPSAGMAIRSSGPPGRGQ